MLCLKSKVCFFFFLLSCVFMAGSMSSVKVIFYERRMVYIGLLVVLSATHFQIYLRRSFEFLGQPPQKQ